MWRTNSRFWLMVQVLVALVAVAGAVVLAASFHVEHESARRDRWAVGATLVYLPSCALMGWLAFVSRPISMRLPRWARRAYWRRRDGRCAKCGYDLRWKFNAGCPECGWRRTGGQLPLPVARRRRRVRRRSRRTP